MIEKKKNEPVTIARWLFVLHPAYERVDNEMSAVSTGAYVLARPWPHHPTCDGWRPSWVFLPPVLQQRLLTTWLSFDKWLIVLTNSS